MQFIFQIKKIIHCRVHMTYLIQFKMLIIQLLILPLWPRFNNNKNINLQNDREPYL